MLKVLIADDHPIVRQGFKQVLMAEGDIVVSGEAASGEEVLRLARAEDWDVVVLDISMPDGNGLDVLRALKAERPSVPVLILSMHAEDQFAVRTLKAGAAGYLSKESVPDELVKAVRKIVGGSRYISDKLAEVLAADLTGDSTKLPHELLSDREYQVMRMIAVGKAPKEIAEELSLSIKTVSTYRSRILEKLNLRTNADIIHYAIQNRLVET